jgi:DNA-binding transcriptional LysR family regulator
MTSRMNIPEIEAFVAVAETGSMSRAAIRLTLLSSSTPSRFDAAIRFLGHELNSKLSEEAGA